MTRRTTWQKIVAFLAATALVAGLIGYAFVPTPVHVEIRTVERGRLQVAVEDDGKTRIKEKYVISAPISGRLARVQLHAGDPVTADQTMLTTLDPTAPALLDARSRAEASARLKAAEAARKRTDPLAEVAREQVRITGEEYERAKQLYQQRSISEEERDRREFTFRSAREELRAAEFAVQIAEHELALARAAFVHAGRNGDSADTVADDWRITIHSPVSGRILRVLQESAAVVSAGAPLMEVGDPHDLEVVIDVLSSDAVTINPGDPALLDDWGGSQPLAARVRRVEPSGFTKVSALGIEEQRVNVILDLDQPASERSALGDDFRVVARIIVDQAEDVLKVPLGALFREGDAQAVFVVENGRARVRTVTIGRRSRLEAETVSGLHAGEQVIAYPSDKVREGVWVQVR